MPKKLSIEEVKKRIYEIHGDEVTLDESTWVNTNTKARFVDKDYGEWWTLGQTVLNGAGHSKRGYIKRKLPRTLSVEQVEERIRERFGDDLVLDKSTFKNTYTKARFVHKKHGDWWVIPKQIWIYGFDHPVISRKRGATKRAKTTATDFRILYHWKTDEEVVCQGSYERKVVRYFNENEIDFEWQPGRFEMPDGKHYHPDCLLVKENKYVEIKGYFRGDAKKKWDWFHEKYPNSELWDTKVLKKKGIL